MRRVCSELKAEIADQLKRGTVWKFLQLEGACRSKTLNSRGNVCRWHLHSFMCEFRVFLEHEFSYIDQEVYISRCKLKHLFHACKLAQARMQSPNELGFN